MGFSRPLFSLHFFISLTFVRVYFFLSALVRQRQDIDIDINRDIDKEKDIDIDLDITLTET